VENKSTQDAAWLEFVVFGGGGRIVKSKKTAAVLVRGGMPPIVAGEYRAEGAETTRMGIGRHHQQNKALAGLAYRNMKKNGRE